MELFSEIALCQYYAMTGWTLVTAVFFKEVYSITNTEQPGEASVAVDKVAYLNSIEFFQRLRQKTMPATETDEKTENKSETVETVQVFSKANQSNLKSSSPLRASDLMGMSLNPEM